MTFRSRCRRCGSSEVRYRAAVRKSHDFWQESIAEMIFEFSCPLKGGGMLLRYSI